MDQNFDCIPCGFTSTNRYNYDIHIRTVKHKARMEGLQCTQCGATYNSRNKLTRHVKNVHVKKEKRITGYLNAVKEEKESTVAAENQVPTGKSDPSPTILQGPTNNIQDTSDADNVKRPLPRINIKPKLQPKKIIQIQPKILTKG
jgi:uncharacterized C2H2 Zn-finger protein